MTTVLPPPDTSGGYFVVEYSNAGTSHRQRLHLAAFDPITLAYAAPTGTETVVGDTIDAYLDIIIGFYTASWTFDFVSLWVNLTGTPAPVPIPPVIAAEVGTHAAPEATSPAGEAIFNLRSNNGSKGKLVLIAPAAWDVAAPTYVTSGSAAPTGTIMGYLSGNQTQLRTRQNGKFIDYAHVTNVENRRLRRHFHLN